MEKIEVYKSTNDEWCGNYILSTSNRQNISSLVRVYFLSNEEGYSIGVVGTDDFGMYKNFPIEHFTKQDAIDLFLKIISLETLNQENLYILGLRID